MGRCNHVINHITIFCLLLSLNVASFQNCENDVRNQVLSLFYGGEISSPYTCDDYFGIQHGNRCRKKCNAVTATLSDFGCNPSLIFPQCSLRPSRKRRDLDFECGRQTTSCSTGYEYRHIDGSCNNLRNPLWGKSDRIQNRLIFGAYDDGRDSPRTTGCIGKLPSPRAISNILHKADFELELDSKLSYMMMQTGQLLAHDLVLTKLFERSDGVPLQCCTEDRDHPECFPIEIPPDDPHFKPGSCMNFARSLARRDCNDIRQQVNSQTSYIDLSMVYGATDREAKSLRSLQKGLMKTVGNKLPVDMTDETCELSRPQHIPNYYCTLAGDIRSNEQPGLASIHTLFVREHNRLAERLAVVNPHWDDEKLYQVARKINIGQWQNIVYTEYLPNVLDQRTMRKYNLETKVFGYKDTYRINADATITNSFAASSLRYGHSLIHRNVSMLSFDMIEMMSPDSLDHTFFNPDLYHKYGQFGLENILLWTSSTRCPMRDRQIEKSVRENLFRDKDNNSLDLAAVNIQRGRDHGLPSYNEFRKLCGLSEVHHFGTEPGGLVDHHPYSAELISKAYACPEDIDLYPGYLSELNSIGSILGPTGQCLVAMQFKSLRDGDRFFFERRDRETPWIGFSPAQLAEIKRVKMSTLFCLNTSIVRLQRDIFRSPVNDKFSRDRLVPCNTRRGVNLDLWRDRFI